MLFFVPFGGFPDRPGVGATVLIRKFRSRTTVVSRVPYFLPSNDRIQVGQLMVDCVCPGLLVRVWIIAIFLAILDVLQQRLKAPLFFEEARAQNHIVCVVEGASLNPRRSKSCNLGALGVLRVGLQFTYLLVWMSVTTVDFDNGFWEDPIWIVNQVLVLKNT